MASEKLYKTFFDEEVVEDRDEVIDICEASFKSLKSNFNLDFRDEDNNDEPDPILIGSFFAKTYKAIVSRLLNEREKNSSFEINIADTVLFGFETSAENEDDEKNGNFMIYVRNLDSTKKLEGEVDVTKTAKELCVQWMNENILANPEIIKEIAVSAKKLLKDIDISIVSSDCIMPVFYTVYVTLINILSIKRREQDLYEHEINFINCFNIGARESENGIDKIYIRPNIDSKLLLKSDASASSQYE